MTHFTFFVWLKTGIQDDFKTDVLVYKTSRPEASAKAKHKASQKAATFILSGVCLKDSNEWLAKPLDLSW